MAYLTGAIEASGVSPGSPARAGKKNWACDPCWAISKRPLRQRKIESISRRGRDGLQPVFVRSRGKTRAGTWPQIHFRVIVNLLKLTPNSTPLPLPVSASETSPLVIA